MNEKDLQRLKELAQAATPGPWKRGTYGWVYVDHKEDTYAVAACQTKSGSMRNWNANEEFIAAANPAAILELIAMVEAKASTTAAEGVRHAANCCTNLDGDMRGPCDCGAEGVPSIDTPEFLGRVIAAASEVLSIGQGGEWDSFIAHLNADKAAAVAAGRARVAEELERKLAIETKWASDMQAKAVALGDNLAKLREQKPVAWWRFSYIEEDGSHDLDMYYGDDPVIHYRDNGHPWNPLHASPVAAQPEAVSVPEGWKLVPLKATPAMRAAWDRAPQTDDDDRDFAGAYGP